ncbi:MAG: beta-glucosidase family protein [Spirochaeta sp.]
MHHSPLLLQQISRMSVREKCSLLSGSSFWHLQDIPEQDIPGIMVADGPHGLRKQPAGADHLGISGSVPATCFPTASALACSWDRGLIRKVGEFLGKEALSEGVSVLLGPGVNIKRHPLCGRNFEYFSEDPLLSGELAASYIAGVQSQGVGTSLKHFAVNNQEYFRQVIDVVVDERTLRELYLPAFEIAVKKAQPWTIMCSYNRINGVYSCENTWLLRELLKNEWGHTGLVVTDWGAMNDRVAALRASLDLEMPGNNGINDQLVEQAVLSGRLPASFVDEAVLRVLQLCERGRNVLESAPVAYDVESHHACAAFAAEASIVLLKNENNILPLDETVDIAVLGEMARTPRYQGAGSSQIVPTRIDNAVDCITEVAGREPRYSRGYDMHSDMVDEGLIQHAVETAASADAVIVFAGLPGIYESEGFDRDHMDLPENQNALIWALVQRGIKLVVVLSNGAPVSMPWIDEIHGLFEGYLGGQAGARAMTRLLFGRANPRGKLAETFPLSVTDLPADDNFPGTPDQVQYREGLYVGYRYVNSVDCPVLFPFGYGLSYTRYEYSDLRLLSGASGLSAENLRAGDAVALDFQLHNIGSRSGTEVVQLYVEDAKSSMYRPRLELKEFAAVALGEGEIQRPQFSLDYRSFAFWDTYSGSWQIESGEFIIHIAASSRDIRLSTRVYIESDYQAVEVPLLPHPMREYKYPVHPMRISLQAFEALLGYVPPVPRLPRPFHSNSSLTHLRHSLKGRLFRRLVRWYFRRFIAPTVDLIEGRMMERMLMEAPLRTFALMSGGKLRFHHIDILVAVLNNRFITALRLLFSR